MENISIILIFLFVEYILSGAYCLSISDSESIQIETISASDVLLDIQANTPINLNGVIIVGDLDANKLNLYQRYDARVISAPITITNSIIKGNVDFRNAIFLHKVNFRNTTFGGFTYFNEAILQDDVNFGNTCFDRYAGFLSTKFRGDTSFDQTKFNGLVSFWNSSFMGYTSFQRANFEKDAYFWLAKFDKNTLFKDANFRLNASFQGVNFSRNVNFDRSLFNRTTSFEGDQFNGVASFRYTQFDGETTFQGVKFINAATFQGANFSNNVTFRGVQFYGNTSFMDANYRKHIDLRNVGFNLFYVKWESFKHHLIFDRNIYLRLIENYEYLGWFNDADDCYYDYRKELQYSKSLGWSKFKDCVVWLVSGYGVRPDYTLLEAIIIIFISGTIFWTGDGIRDTKRYKKALGKKHRITSRKVSPLFRNHFLLDMRSFILSKLNISSYLLRSRHVSFYEALCFSTIVFIAKIPTDYRAIGRYKYFAVLEGILGWMFLGAVFSIAVGHAIK